MDKYAVLQKKDFNEFIKELKTLQKVVAPVSLGHNNFAFKEIESGDEITVDYIPTVIPPKKYFMPQKEKILKFNVKEHKWEQVTDSEELIVFGVHTCDLAGIQCLNMVFNKDPKDLNYNTRREKITTIGLECNKYCDEHAGCTIMDNHIPNGGYDLFMTDLKDSFIMHISTEMGEKIVASSKVLKDASESDLKELEAAHAAKREVFKNETPLSHNDLKPLFEKSLDHKVWGELGKKCLSCGNCTNVCPTCYCFDVKDDINLDLNTGGRTRIWDSCQNETFARVAGYENFREERGDRQKHRFMRKFNYPVDKYSRYFCTGCGRCSRTCMAGITIKDTISELVK